MRFRPLLSALAAAALAAPAPAAALQWSGSVGTQYSREDAWVGDESPASRHFDLNLGLSLNGFVYRPGVFAYGLSGEYRRASETRTGASESVRDLFQYRGRATLFGDPRTPVSLSAHALRSTEQSARTASDPIGLDVEATAYGAEARYREPGRPSFSANYSRTETTSRVPLLADATRATHSFGASTAHGAAGFSYNAAYQTSQSDGTYATDAFDDHRVTVFATATVADRTEVRLSDSYYLRVPTEQSPFSPRQELNALRAVLTRYSGTSNGNFDQVAYGHSRGVQVAEDHPDIDRTSQQFGYATQRTLSNREWRLRGNLDASLAQNRVGTTEHRDAGQSLGLGLVWARNLPDSGYVELRGGPTLGLVEPDGEGIAYGYGASAGGSYRRAVGATTYETGYDLSFASDVGDLGTSFRQQAHGSASSPVGTGSVRGQLTVTAQRRDSPRVGVAAHRSATLAGSYGWHRYALSGDLGISSGVSAPVTNAGVGDGLFLSLPYDTHTYTASLGGTAGVTDRLSFGVTGRFVSSSLPDRPDVTEREARGTIRYTIGAFSVALDDRYTISQVTGGTARRNLLFVSVNRSFGSRY